MKNKINNILRILSAWIQGPTESFKRHNSQYESPGKFERDRDAGYKNLETDVINGPEMRVRDLLLSHQNITTAVDVGSGTGWSAAALSPLMDLVIALEPSQAALDISKRAYGSDKYPNITWIEGFAEKILPEISLKTPTLFLTGCVLSHLRDKEVLKICAAINEVAPSESVLSFAECWGDKNSHQIMWHIRTKEWWQNALPGWVLDFHGPLHINGDCHMGFWGVKK